MFKIGEFSKLTQVSTRMLRYYDETGLLKPAKVDSLTGYRMYSAEQISTLNRIIYLRDSGFNVAEIALALDCSNDTIIEQLDKKSIEIMDNIQKEQEKLKKIEIAKKELLDEFYSDEYSRYINMDFLTPVAFKSNGRYMILPDIRLIYQSLMNKYSATSDDMDMYDEETLEQLVSCSEIAQYKLKSAFFPLEGVRVPAFKGELCIKVKGTSTMAKYVRLLARYGEYSGVGIKTAIGMGALQMKKWGKKDD